jgi:phosphohistidine phosphatase
VLRRASKAAVKPTLIISSPYKRAMETAEIAARELQYHSEIVKSERLTPHSTPHDLWNEVRAHRDEPAILLTGHEPLFSAAVAWMVGSTRAMVDFKKGGLARIDFATVSADPRGVLQWMLTAKLS